MATSTMKRERARVVYRIDRLRNDDLAYYTSQVRAWSRDDDERGRRNVAIYTRRLERAKARLAQLHALLEVSRGK